MPGRALREPGTSFESVIASKAKQSIRVYWIASSLRASQ
jgi:hypothetical protein